MNCDVRTQIGDGSDGRAPSESWLFAQAVLGKPIPRIIRPEVIAKAKLEELERLSAFSTRHADELRRLQAAERAACREREVLEWSARISTEAEDRLRKLVRQEAEESEAWRRAEQFVETLREGNWDASKHPRGGFPQNRGWWSPTSGSGFAAPAGHKSNPFRTAAFRGGHVPVHLAATGASAWAVAGPTTTLVPNVGSGVAAGARAATGTVAGGLAAGLKNASMGAYWARVPAAQVMPDYWAYGLEKRVRAGTLSNDDAEGIFSTALLGAEAQKFKPTGTTGVAVHKSIMDFLDKAEAVCFARKKKAAAEGATGAEGTEATPERVTGGALDDARKEFERMKSRLWKQEAETNPHNYTPEQLALMTQGKAPRDAGGKPMEIHHKRPLSEGGSNTFGNMQFGTRNDHRIGPNFKKNHPNLPRGRRP